MNSNEAAGLFYMFNFLKNSQEVAGSCKLLISGIGALIIISFHPIFRARIDQYKTIKNPKKVHNYRQRRDGKLITKYNAVP